MEESPANRLLAEYTNDDGFMLQLHSRRLNLEAYSRFKQLIESVSFAGSEADTRKIIALIWGVPMEFSGFLTWVQEQGGDPEPYSSFWNELHELIAYKIDVEYAGEYLK